MKKRIKLSSEIIQKVYGQNSSELDNSLDEIKDLVDNDGRTLLFHAVLAKNYRLLNALIAKNADVNHVDNLLWIPLHYAVQNYLIEFVDVLIKNGSNVNAQDKYGNSVLWRAVFDSKGKGDVIKILLDNGALKDLKNNFNISPIDLANTIANYDVKQFLLS